VQYRANKEQERDWIEAETITVLDNLANQRVVHLDMIPGFAVALLRSEEDSKAQTSVAVYSFDKQTEAFKVLTEKDLGVENSEHLWPSFFQNANGEQRLLVNIGSKTQGAVTLRLEGFQIAVIDAQKVKNTTSIRFTSPNGQTEEIQIGTLFRLPLPPIRNSSTSFLFGKITVTIGLILLLLSMPCYFLARHITSNRPDSLAGDLVEKLNITGSKADYDETLGQASVTKKDDTLFNSLIERPQEPVPAEDAMSKKMVTATTGLPIDFN
jgi:hypothetical protein